MNNDICNEVVVNLMAAIVDNAKKDYLTKASNSKDFSSAKSFFEKDPYELFVDHPGYIDDLKKERAKRFGFL